MRSSSNASASLRPSGTAGRRTNIVGGQGQLMRPSTASASSTHGTARPSSATVAKGSSGMYGYLNSQTVTSPISTTTAVAKSDPFIPLNARSNGTHVLLERGSPRIKRVESASANSVSSPFSGSAQRALTTTSTLPTKLPTNSTSVATGTLNAPSALNDDSSNQRDRRALVDSFLSNMKLSEVGSAKKSTTVASARGSSPRQQPTEKQLVEIDTGASLPKPSSLLQLRPAIAVAQQTRLVEEPRSAPATTSVGAETSKKSTSIPTTSPLDTRAVASSSTVSALISPTTVSKPKEKSATTPSATPPAKDSAGLGFQKGKNSSLFIAEKLSDEEQLAAAGNSLGARKADLVHFFPTNGFFACKRCGLPFFSAQSKLAVGGGYGAFSRHFKPSLTASVLMQQQWGATCVVMMRCSRCDSFVGHLSQEKSTDGDFLQVNALCVKHVPSTVPPEFVACEGPFDATEQEEEEARLAQKRRIASWGTRRHSSAGSDSEDDESDEEADQRMDEELSKAMRNQLKSGRKK